MRDQIPMLRTRLLRQVHICTAWFLLLAVSATATAQTRIVAIGDVHGALPEFESILKEAGLLGAKRGAKGGWAGGNAVLVQLGDVVDRGPQSRACMDLLMDLERTALKQKKGHVVALLGNHEVMAMTGDLRYVAPEDYQRFSTSKSEQVRQSAYRDFQNYVADRARAGMPMARSVSSEQWMTAHPLGYFERRDAFGPQGVYGRWLRQHATVYQSDGIAFVHGGLSPNSSFDTLDTVNAQMRGALSAFDRGWESLANAGIIWRYMTIDEAVIEIQRERAAIPMREVDDAKRKEELANFIDLLTWLQSPDNPTWYRGLAQQAEQTLAPSLQAMMSRLKIKVIVAGHSVIPSFEVTQRFGGRVTLIDTGMLHAVFGGEASALQIQGGRFTALSPGKPPRDLAQPPDDAVGGESARP
jgi:hypothetical protein